MKRKIVIITISYICGLIWGLYFYNIISIFLFTILNIYIIIRSKNKLIITCMIVILCACMYMHITSNIYNKYTNIDEVKIEGIILNKYKESDYNTEYIMKVTNPQKFRNIKIILKTKKNNNIQYADKVRAVGKFEIADYQRNYKGYNYNEYLRTKRIFGTVTANNDSIKVICNGEMSKYNILVNKLYENLKQKLYKIMPEDSANMCNALILGDKSNISEEIIDSFSICNLSHILAISGMHMTYIILFFSYMILGCKKSEKNIILIIIVTVFCNLVGNSESIVRATIMTVLYILAELLNRKSDSLTNLSLASLVILIINPYSILNLSFLLSSGGTLGILLFYNIIIKMFNYIKILNKNKLTKYIKQSISLSISANIIILPIIIIYYHKFSYIFIISNILASLLLSCIMPLIFTSVFVSFFSINLARIISILLDFFIKCLTGMVSMLSKLKFTSIIICTPYLFSVIMYYVIVLIQFIKFNSKQSKKLFLKKLSKKLLIIYISICLITNIARLIDENMYIHFVDVGQGDCTFIQTRNNKKILIDGGGNEIEEDYVGENILLPYLLNRRSKVIDYIFISHFDSDHCQGLLYVMQNIKVKNVIISKQFEYNENYKKFLKIAKQEKINIKIANKGDKIYIEKNLYFEVLWPDAIEPISDNKMNNNSLVCKMVYKKFSILFTGDIEKIAEEKIIETYKNETNKLKATIIKIPHHGSKTSSTMDFIEKVKPQEALIGVGKKNKFGHPAITTIQTLQNQNIKIYRTDEMGEITIETNGKKYKVTKLL